MPLRVPHSVRREAIDVRGVDRAAVAAERGETDVVQDDVDDAGSTFGCARRFERRPVWLRVTDVDLDLARKRANGHYGTSTSTNPQDCGALEAAASSQAGERRSSADAMHGPPSRVG